MYVYLSFTMYIKLLLDYRKIRYKDVWGDLRGCIFIGIINKRCNKDGYEGVV